MIVTFARDQTIVAEPATSQEFTTDPIPLNGRDRATALPYVAVMQVTTPPGLATLEYWAQVSNDGVAWVEQGPSGSIVQAGAGARSTALVTCAFLRFRMRLTVGVVSSGNAFVTFDLPVHVDKVSEGCTGCHADEPCTACAGGVSPEVVTPQPFSGTMQVAAAGGSGGGGVVVPQPLDRSAMSPRAATGPAGAVAAESRAPWGTPSGFRGFGKPVFVNGVWTVQYPDFTDAATGEDVSAIELLRMDQQALSGPEPGAFSTKLNLAGPIAPSGPGQAGFERYLSPGAAAASGRPDWRTDL